MVGNVSLTLRTSLLIREFARLSGKSISVRIGPVIHWREMEPLRDRKDLIRFLYRRGVRAGAGAAGAPARHAQAPAARSRGSGRLSRDG